MYVQWGLMLQMLIWFNLYHYDFVYEKLLETFFYLGGLLSMLLVYVYQPRIGYFTPFILIQYIMMVIYTTAIFSQTNPINKAVSLGFLLVFFNSFYWELPYHLLEMYNAGPRLMVLDWWIVRLPQWIRLTPGFFLYKNYEIKNYKYLSAGLLISYMLMYIRLKYKMLGTEIHPLARFICLSFLIYTLIKSKPRRDVWQE